jgi:hypothetical protein
VVFLFLSLSLHPRAQSANATLSGTITDVTGAPMPRVTVTATNIQTDVVSTALSNETGVYNFPSLPLGVYQLSASRPGFLTQNLTDIQLGNVQHRINFTLPVASVVQTLDVITPTTPTMDAPMATSSASAGFVLSESMVRHLPLVGNDALSLVRMLPGVNAEGGPAGGMSMGSVLTFAGIP